jgi:hypothetical protein
MPRATARPTARAVPRPDLRRWFLGGAVVATLSLLWTSFASAQSTEAVSETAAVVASETAVTDAPAPVQVQALIGPRLPESSLVSRAAVERRLERATTTAPAANVADGEPGFRRNVALLAVGIAAIAIGTSVDDGAGTVLILGGAGLSLYGLYQILK